MEDVGELDVGLTINLFDFVNLMCHGNAQFHIRPTAKYLVKSCVCVAVRLRSGTIEIFLTNRWFDFVFVRDET